MLLTFSEIKNSDVPDDAGVCGTSSQFKDYVNRAVRMLMNRGSFYGTVQKIQVCTTNTCQIVWPRSVGSVLATNVNGSHSTVKDNWYGFLPLSRGDFGSGGFGFSNGTCFGNLVTSDQGQSPVFNPVTCGTSVYIRVYTGVRDDVGKTTTIYGVDNNGQTVRTQVNGVWQEGEMVTLALPYVQTTTLFRTVTRISKVVTQGVTRYYQFNPIGNYTYDLAIYDPTETNPSYRTSRIEGVSNGCCSKSIVALVKLEFIPVVNDTDLVMIDNMDALSDMIKSIREKKAGNPEKAFKFETSAVRELNLQLRNKFPNDQIVASVDYGQRSMQRSRIGNLM